MKQDTNRIEHHVDLPEGALPLSVVEVVEYLDADGNRVYGYRHQGSTALSATIGLLDLAKHNLMSRAKFG